VSVPEVSTLTLEGRPSGLENALLFRREGAPRGAQGLELAKPRLLKRLAHGLAIRAAFSPDLEVIPSKAEPQ
jgi:hypothetical protein